MSESYSEDPGLTKRLAKSFACLVSETMDGRDARYQEFLKFYDVRSDIVHGRAHEHHESSQNLENLEHFSDRLRLAWQRVLSDSGIQEILEQGDTARKSWFTSRECGYTAPSEDK